MNMFNFENPGFQSEIDELDQRYSDSMRRYLRNLKHTTLPPEMEVAIEQLVESGIRGFDDVMLSDYALVDILFRFQMELYDILEAKVPFDVSFEDPDCVDILFDDGSCVYYEVKLPWELEKILDKRMNVLSVGAVLSAMELAAQIRAQESYDTDTLEERIDTSDSAQIIVIEQKRIPPIAPL